MSYIPINTRIKKQLDQQLVNSGIELDLCDEYDDMIYICEDLNGDKFIGGAEHKREYDELNKYYGYMYKLKRKDIMLFSFAIVENGSSINIVLYVPHIKYYSWGDTGMSRTPITVKLENAAECIKLVNAYCKNNPILYTIEELLTYNEKLYKSDVVKALRQRAESEFNELQLVIQAANI